MFSPTNKFRIAIANMLSWKWTETLVMLIIILHGCILISTGWANDPEAQPPFLWGQTWQQYAVLVIFCFYTIFMFLRIIVYGFIINHKDSQQTSTDNTIHISKAFLRHSWNRVDFISIIAFWIDFAILYTNQEFGDPRKITEFKMLSSIIIMRLLNITKGNAVILHSLKKAAPLLVNVIFFVFFFFIIFAIIGVQSFKGSFLRHCVPIGSDNVYEDELQQYCGGYHQNGQILPYIKLDNTTAGWPKGFICEEGFECRETRNPYNGSISMDNIFSSMLMVLIITGRQSWTDRMYDMMDAEYYVACLYFIVIVIVMNFWLLNLFIGVICEMFAKVREDTKHSAFTSSSTVVLADVEGSWSFKENNMSNIRKRTILQELVIFSKPLWVLLVVIDLIVMACKNNDMTPQQIAMLDSVETGFTLVFLVEILIRLFAERKQLKSFFMDKSNQVDLLIVMMTCIICIPPIRANTIAYAWLSGFQVMRIYRVLIAIPRIRNLIVRVLGTVYGYINLIFFIIFCTLICAIIAFELLEGQMALADDSLKFMSIFNSFVALNQLFSGEDWTTVLYNAMSYGATTKNAVINALFLSLWFAFSNFIMVNMFIAILMENFETAEEEKRQRQVQQYAQRHDSVNQNEIVITSKWNIYRYIRPNPTTIDIDGIPTNLKIPVQKSDIKEFMKDSDIMYGNGSNEKFRLYGQTHQQRKKQPFSSVRKFMNNHFANIKHAGLSNDTIRKSIQIDGQTTLDQLQTFYDINRKHDDGDDDNNSKFNSLRNALAPSLRANFAVSAEEINLHDIEEKRAMQRDFLRAHPSYDQSLFFFSPRHPLRRLCQRLVPASYGERTFGTDPTPILKFIFLSIVISCVITNVVLTVYNSPVFQFNHRNDEKALLMLEHADWAFTIVFTVEFIVKIIADGFIMTPNAYLLNGWNLLDLFVLVTLYISNFGQFAASTGLERGFRAFKALRALRLINLLRPAKEMFTVILIQGLPLILDAAVLGLFLIIPFALYGKNIFMGLLYSCNGDVSFKSECINEGMLPTEAPVQDGLEILAPLVWSNPYVYSFDNFGSSLLTLFEIASGEGWIDVLEASMSIVGKDQNASQNASQLWGIFFMVYNFAGSVFVISLFLGIILENFEKRNGTAYMTTEQRRWLDLKKLLSQIRPAKRPKQVPTNPIRRKCYDLVVDKRGRFYKCMTWVIVLNIIFLCTETDQENLIWSEVKEYLYLGFVVIYWVEVLIKLFGLGWTSFRKNLWNIYDIIVLIGSAVTVIFSLINDEHQVNVESQKLFMTALSFKLVQRSDGLNQLFTTMVASAYQIGNVFAVWFVVVTTYSIMFMQIFGLTKYGTQATTEHVNFRTYANTLVSLVRYSTGEGWNGVMHDFTIEEPHCVVAENYLDSDCGSLRWSYFLFLSFNVVSMYIFTAVFVAVVANNFSYVYQVAANFTGVNRDEIRKYKKYWAEFDEERTGFITSKDYMSFWRRLDGMFLVRLYDENYSYKKLVESCKETETFGQAVADPYQVRVNINMLSKKLASLDKAELHKRKQDLNKIYWETAMTETLQGVSFNQMLLLLARRKLIVPENALLLEELLNNRKKEEAIDVLINIDKVKGLLETIALRKKFIRHMKMKKQQQQQNLSTIIDNKYQIPIITTPLSPSFNLGSPMMSPLMSPSVSSTGYISDENDIETEWNSMSALGSGSILEDSTTTATHDIWHGLLQNEIDK
ncbi:Ion transport protein-domain-containing protein [Cunninghamella echinulata]|nr:Ion transport protein-domain-containing protein [Cunninghamella echinulata]